MSLSLFCSLTHKHTYVCVRSFSPSPLSPVAGRWPPLSYQTVPQSPQCWPQCLGQQLATSQVSAHSEAAYLSYKQESRKRMSRGCVLAGLTFCSVWRPLYCWRSWTLGSWSSSQTRLPHLVEHWNTWWPSWPHSEYTREIRNNLSK